jgi:phosphate transport system substrate-binding protein
MRAIALAVVTATVFFLQAALAQAITITGVVADTRGNPVAHASVSLIRNGIVDTTDSNGVFHLVSETGVSGLFQQSDRPSFYIQGRMLHFYTTNDHTPVHIDLFDVNGRHRNTLCNGVFAAGMQRIPLPAGRAVPDAMLVLRLRCGATTTTVRIFGGNGVPGSRMTAPGPWQNRAGAIAGIRAGSGDTVRVAALSFLTKRSILAVLPDTLDTLVLVDSSLGLSCATYPKIDGSTSAQPLACVIASRLLGTSYGWEMTSDGSKRIMAFSTDKPQTADSINTKVAVHTGTHTAYVNVINGTADLALICREPSADERRLADSLHVDLDVIPAAHDAFVFIVNSLNPVTGITVSDARAIYTGTLNDWSALGGVEKPIKRYQREANSGSQELMMTLVMKELTPISAPDMIVTGMMGPFNVLATDTLGICYTVYFFKEFMAPGENVKSLAIGGIAPNYANIINRNYPLNADVVLVTRKNPGHTTAAYALREFILSEQGQAVVKESGYVPMFE